MLEDYQLFFFNLYLSLVNKDLVEGIREGVFFSISTSRVAGGYVIINMIIIIIVIVN